MNDYGYAKLGASGCVASAGAQVPTPTRPEPSNELDSLGQRAEDLAISIAGVTDRFERVLARLGRAMPGQVVSATPLAAIPDGHLDRIRVALNRAGEQVSCLSDIASALDQIA